MASVSSRELRNHTRAVLDRVAGGECIAITVQGREVAVMVPPSGRSRWMPRERFLDMFSEHQADPGLAAELRELLPGTTDDLGDP